MYKQQVKSIISGKQIIYYSKSHCTLIFDVYMNYVGTLYNVKISMWEAYLDK